MAQWRGYQIELQHIIAELHGSTKDGEPSYAMRRSPVHILSLRYPVVPFCDNGARWILSQ